MRLFKSNNFRQRTSSLALLAMLFQLALATFHMPMAVAMDGMPEIATDGNQTIIICTASGMKRVTLDADGNAIDEEQLVDNQNSCSHCSVACDLTCNFTAASLLNASHLDLSYLQYEYGQRYDRTPANFGGLDPPHQI